MRAPRAGLQWSRGRVARRGIYDGYIHSPEWREHRAAWMDEWLIRYGMDPVCLVCGQPWTLRTGDLHHRTYDRLTDERFNDLVPLCRVHHTALHDIWDASSAWRRMGRATATMGIIAVLRRIHEAGTR